MLFLLFLLLGFCIFISFNFVQYQKYRQANRLYQQARLEERNSLNPDDISKFKAALAIYKQCHRIIGNAKYASAIDNCQKKIDDCLRYQSLITVGRNKAIQNYFKEALHDFQKAKELFLTDELKSEINRCNLGVARENQYERVLEQANQIAREGKFSTAIDLLIPAVKIFVRQDGEHLLNKLRIVVRGKDLYQLGLIAEDRGEIKNAIANYRQALELIPEYIDCKLRLATIAVKDNPQQAINCLKAIEGEPAAYIRGFAYTQLGNWQQADREWRAIDRSAVKVQRNIVNSLIKKERLTVRQKIQQLVDENNLDKAKLVSINFIQQNNGDLVIQNNLSNYIKPSIECQMWQTKDWREIAIVTKENWLKQQDIKSLHNWAIATYYQAQIYPHKLTDLIIAWTTALANIQSNPILQDIPWLGNNYVDLQNTFAKLKQILENAIDLVKDNDIEEYLKLRDIYRRDMVMLSITQQNGNGIRIKSQLLILPNCYQCFSSHFQQTKLPSNVWGALYTDWGTAVAACYEKDVARAIKIKPKQDPVSEVEHFAYCFVSYYEGCHYLEHQYWRKAMKYLQEAKPEIMVNSNWCHEIDRLCEMQLQQISEFNDHLELAKLWYLLIGSQPAKTYYVEHRSMQIGMDVDNKKLSFQQAIGKLIELQNIDPDNSVALNIIKTLKINLELEKINHLWQKSEYEAAVKIAKRSPHTKVRFAVAEVCLQIVLEILESSSLTIESVQSLQKITQWAYELCPNEPLFQSTYSQLQELGIHD